jgi:hypothetical protein
MDPQFKKWIVDRHDRMESAAARENFLKKLKHSPDTVLKYIQILLAKWMRLATQETGRAIAVYNPNEESQEVLQAFQEHFARELARITT